MMLFRYFCAFCLLLLFALPLFVWAHPTESPTACDSCPSTSYSSSAQTSFILDSTSGCTVTLHYRTRVCNGVYELKVDSIGMSSACNGMAIEDLVNASIAKFVLFNKMNFPPISPDTGHKVWRVLRQSCWKYTEDTHSPGAITGAIPCEGECCIAVFDVYKNERCEGISFQDRKQKGKADCPLCTDEPPPTNTCCNTCHKELLHYYFDR